MSMSSHSAESSAPLAAAIADGGASSNNGIAKLQVQSPTSGPTRPKWPPVRVLAPAGYGSGQTVTVDGHLRHADPRHSVRKGQRPCRWSDHRYGRRRRDLPRREPTSTFSHPVPVPNGPLIPTTRGVPMDRSANHWDHHPDGNPGVELPEVYTTDTDLLEVPQWLGALHLLQHFQCGGQDQARRHVDHYTVGGAKVTTSSSSMYLVQIPQGWRGGRLPAPAYRRSPCQVSVATWTDSCRTPSLHIFAIALVRRSRGARVVHARAPRPLTSR